MMTVRALRLALEGLDGERIVVLSADAEGNHYSPLAAATPTTSAACERPMSRLSERWGDAG